MAAGGRLTPSCVPTNRPAARAWQLGRRVKEGLRAPTFGEREFDQVSKPRNWEARCCGLALTLVPRGSSIKFQMGENGAARRSATGPVFVRPLLSKGRQFLCTSARAPRRKLGVGRHIARLSLRAVRASVLDSLCAVAISSLAARADRNLIYGFRLGAL
jgi:hypothetical protein